MMFELRWVLREIIVGDWGGHEVAETRKVLQYRQATNVLEIGVQPPIWSEWEDVPTVNEQ